MLAAACGSMFASACKSSPSANDGGQPDATNVAQQDSPTFVIQMPEAGGPTDISETDLSTTICE